MSDPTKVERPFDFAPPPVTENKDRLQTGPEISAETMNKLVENEDRSLKSVVSGLEGLYVDVDLPPQASEALKANAEQARTIVERAHVEANTVLRELTHVSVEAKTMLKAEPPVASDVETIVSPLGETPVQSSTRADRPSARKDVTEREPELAETPKDAVEMAKSALERAEMLESRLSDVVRASVQNAIDRAVEAGDVDAVAFWTERLAKERLRTEAERVLRGSISLELDLAAKLGRTAGVTQPRVISMEGGGDAVYKPQANENAPDVVANASALEFRAGERSLFAREWLNGQIDRALGLEVVPPTIIRTNGGGIGSVQGWVEGKTVEGVEDWKEKASAESVEAVAALHVLSGNFDGRDPNLMVTADGRLMAIDNGYTFLPREYLSGGRYQSDRDIMMQSRALDAVTVAATTEALKDPAAIRQDYKQIGVVYLDDPEAGPHTPLTSVLQRRLDTFLSDDASGTLVRSALKEAFSLALGEEAGAYFEEFVTRAKGLREKGFAPYNYPEWQEAKIEAARMTSNSGEVREGRRQITRVDERARTESGTETRPENTAVPAP